MKKIPSKNYVIYLLICILTISGLITWVNMYNTSKEYRDSTNVRMNFLREIKAVEYKNFASENDNYIIYLSDSDDDNNSSLEKSLRKKLIKKDYISDMVYLNTSNLEIDFLNIINSIYQTNFEQVPNVIVVNEHEIVDVYYINNTTTASDIVNFLEENYD